MLLLLQNNGEDKMPPSGFNQKAINGLLEFIRANYVNAQNEYKGEKLPEDQVLQLLVQKMENEVYKLSDNQFPEIEQKGIQGITIFVTECFKDLVSEIRAGEDKYGRAVTNGQAIDKELKQIGDYLLQFNI